jgi:hypothetical protein
MTLEDENSAAMMVLWVITRAIVYKPIGSRHRGSEHAQLAMMSRDNGAVRYELGSGHAVAQMVRHARTVLKRDPKKHNNAAATAKLVRITVSVRGQLSPYLPIGC